MPRFVSSFALGLALVATSAAGLLPPKRLKQEALFGPTRIRGATGNGRVRVGVSREGELTVLRRPSPSLWDQVAHRPTRTLRCSWTRPGPPGWAWR